MLRSLYPVVRQDIRKFLHFNPSSLPKLLVEVVPWTVTGVELIPLSTWESLF